MKALGMSVLTVALVCGIFWIGTRLWHPGSRAVVKAAGASSAYPLTAAIAQQFQRATRIRVTVGMSQSGEGFKKFCDAEADVHHTTRPITDDERRACATRGVQYYELPVALDAIAIVVNPANTWADSVTLDDLRTAWEPATDGHRRRWRDVRKEWPDLPLSLVGTGRETFEYFTQAVVGEAKPTPAGATPGADDTTVAAAVATDRHALGSVSYTAFDANRKKLRAVPMSTPRGPVSPAPETIENETYPLVRPMLIYVSRAATERDEVRAFVNYYLRHAGPLTSQVNLSPLPARGYELTRARFEHLKLGTAYRGGAMAHLKIEEVLTRETHL